MSDKESVNQDIEAIQEKLNQLIAAYNELKKLNDTDAHLETLKEGFLLKARKNTEKILKYICKKEGIIVTVKLQNGKVDDGRIPMLNDYIFHLKGKKIIDGNINHHLEIIKRWGNRNAHDISNDTAEPDLIKASTIESVYDSFKSFTDWFFIKYEKGAKVDFTKNEYNNQASYKEISEEERAENRRNFKWEKLGVRDYSILKQTKSYKNEIKRKRRIAFFMAITISVIVYIGYYFLSSNLKFSSNKGLNDDVVLNKDQVYDLLVRYFNSSNDINSKAELFFTAKVDTFLFQYNLSPAMIDNIQQANTDYIDNKNSFEKESLYISSQNDSITRWRFWTKYTCYRPKLKKFQKNDRILMEFGITNYGKIKFIKQLEKTPEKYTIDKPN